MLDQFKWLFQITLVSVIHLSDDIECLFLYVVISAELVAADNISNITFPESNSGYNLNNSIFIPANYIQERSMTTGRVNNV